MDLRKPIKIPEATLDEHCNRLLGYERRGGTCIGVRCYKTRNN